MNSELRKYGSRLPMPDPREGAGRPEDREIVARQLGREPTLPFRVAARCPRGLPSVIENEPRREMPTSFWVTCPSLAAAVSRVEAVGGVRQVREEVGAKAVEEVHAEHLRRYGFRVAGIRGGPAGDGGGRVKCLHAFLALHLAGAIPNSVAEWTLERLESLPYADRTRCPECAGCPEPTSPGRTG